MSKYYNSDNSNYPIAGEFVSGEFVPNDIGLKALDLLKNKYKTDFNIVPDARLPFAFSGGFRSQEKFGGSKDPTTRNLFFQPGEPVGLPVLLHEGGHGGDQNLWERNEIAAKNLTNYKFNPQNLAGSFKYILENEALPHVKSEAIAQKAAADLTSTLDPEAGQVVRSDPWFAGYPMSYVNKTARNFFGSGPGRVTGYETVKNNLPFFEPINDSNDVPIDVFVGPNLKIIKDFSDPSVQNVYNQAQKKAAVFLENYLGQPVEEFEGGKAKMRPFYMDQ